MNETTKSTRPKYGHTCKSNDDGRKMMEKNDEDEEELLKSERNIFSKVDLRLVYINGRKNRFEHSLPRKRRESCLRSVLACVS